MQCLRRHVLSRSTRLTRTYYPHCSLSRRSGRANFTAVTHVPLPFDVDSGFAFPIQTRAHAGEEPPIGLRLADCFQIQMGVALPGADGAETNVDTGRVFNGVKENCGQRAYFTGEQIGAATPLPKDVCGWSWGDLVSLVLRERYRVVAQGEWPRTPPSRPSPRESGLPPFEHVWVVAIRRSDGADGVVRWFPELEVRIPFAQVSLRAARRSGAPIGGSMGVNPNTNLFVSSDTPSGRLHVSGPIVPSRSLTSSELSIGLSFLTKIFCSRTIVLPFATVKSLSSFVARLTETGSAVIIRGFGRSAGYRHVAAAP
ncbi:hypothetical protein C8Q80DRAFT_1344053 [Daedaleopsis nitida]|nr:hypothetical protein C8Q80DRAFT_1344053 [Daedaleopsis nitida]